MAAIDISIVIACYNEEPILAQSVARVREAMACSRFSYELIFIDDASSDSTPATIAALVNETTSDRALYHTENVGRGGTVAEGIRHARGRYVGFIDIDLEVPAHYIAPLVDALCAGAQVATGNRIYKLHPAILHRAILSRGYNLLVKLLLRVALRDTETGYKFFNRSAILPVVEQIRENGWFWDTEIMVRAARSGLAIVEIPVLFSRRRDKRSSVHLFRDSCYYLRKLWRFSRTASLPAS